MFLELIHYIWKESLNSDAIGEQCNQCQQNKQLPLTSNHWTQKQWHICLYGSPCRGLGQVQICGRVIPVSGILHLW